MIKLKTTRIIRLLAILLGVLLLASCAAKVSGLSEKKKRTVILSPSRQSSSNDASVPSETPANSGTETTSDGTTSEEVPPDVDLSTLHLSDKMAECAKIRNNYAEYLGKTVKISGYYRFQYFHYIVIYDETMTENVYFEFRYDGTVMNGVSKIEITGVFGEYSDSTGTYPCIDVTELRVLE